MCRYAGKTYKSHYVCFRCRKSFKQISSSDILGRINKNKLSHKAGFQFNKDTGKLKTLISEIENRPIKCPECSQLMADLGLDFKAPKKTALKKWEIVEGIYTIGKVFHSCGCSGPGYIPQNRLEYKDYLIDKLKLYQEYLVDCQNLSKESIPDKDERLVYWSQRISQLNEEILHQGFAVD